jgi:hypothetical protein
LLFIVKHVADLPALCWELSHVPNVVHTKIKSISPSASGTTKSHNSPALCSQDTRRQLIINQIDSTSRLTSGIGGTICLCYCRITRTQTDIDCVNLIVWLEKETSTHPLISVIRRQRVKWLSTTWLGLTMHYTCCCRFGRFGIQDSFH